ncbi:hypothetical protein CKM354_000068400 [Cercospora kikuchii]|uniref:Uncharacterized protein n=1 Tax=Cercospora kikuchii TaxID=84275 RepID=A0A9P3FC54_9PEZI|nr:uncharacterized protein CKM354_000068400 [Cercospora kikuchii]GIZ37230.1 hypothetical protein CKM354_000068400 [Cercospora kikuchii]
MMPAATDRANQLGTGPLVLRVGGDLTSETPLKDMSKVNRGDGVIEFIDPKGRKAYEGTRVIVSGGRFHGRPAIVLQRCEAFRLLDLAPELQTEIFSYFAAEDEDKRIHLKFYHKNKQRYLVRGTFQPTKRAGDEPTNHRMGLHSDALNLMLVSKLIHDTVKPVLYGTNHFDFHSSESIRELKSLGVVGPKGVTFLRDITVVLENSTAANRIVADLSASPLLRKLVIVHERINKCIFSKRGYSVSRLAQDLMPLIDSLHVSRQATPRSYKLQDIVSLKECHCKTCDNTSQGKACCELPACATAHTLFEQKMRELIEAKYGDDA